MLFLSKITNRFFIIRSIRTTKYKKKEKNVYYVWLGFGPKKNKNLLIMI